jgi:hypothetical protein
MKPSDRLPRALKHARQAGLLTADETATIAFAIGMLSALDPKKLADSFEELNVTQQKDYQKIARALIGSSSIEPKDLAGRN